MKDLLIQASSEIMRLRATIEILLGSTPSCLPELQRQIDALDDEKTVPSIPQAATPKPAKTPSKKRWGGAEKRGSY